MVRCLARWLARAGTKEWGGGGGGGALTAVRNLNRENNVTESSALGGQAGDLPLKGQDRADGGYGRIMRRCCRGVFFTLECHVFRNLSAGQVGFHFPAD